MKVTILSEKFQRNGNVIEVILSAKVRQSDPRELPMFDKLFKEITVIGKSVCSPEDEFNEVLGKKIARSRAYKLLYETVYKNFSEVLESIIKRLNITCIDAEKYTRAMKDQREDVKRLLGKSND